MSPQGNDYLGEPLPIEPGDDTAGEPRVEPSKKIHAFSAAAVLGPQHAFKRSLSKTGQGATRMRIFHAKLSDTGLAYIEEQINDWLDNNPDIEIKFTSSTVGVVEAKRSEPNLILTVWY